MNKITLFKCYYWIIQYKKNNYNNFLGIITCLDLNKLIPKESARRNLKVLQFFDDELLRRKVCKMQERNKTETFLDFWNYNREGNYVKSETKITPSSFSTEMFEQLWNRHLIKIGNGQIVSH